MSGLSMAPRRRSRPSSPGHDHQSVIDIGGAEGAVPVQLALAHAHLTGGGFDLPPLAPVFDDYVGGASGSATACASRPATSSPTRCRRPTCW